MAEGDRPRLLLLLPTSTYRAAAFVRAADALGIRLTVASEQDSAFSAGEPDRLLTMDFDDPADCIRVVTAFHERHPLDGVFGVDDLTAVAAAHLAAALGLPGNPVEAAEAAGNKLLQRVRLTASRVPVPSFEHFPTPSAAGASTIPFPAVVKPVSLSASRGVMRVDDRPSLRKALDRLEAVLADAGPKTDRSCLVEEYIPGSEFALEGLVTEGRLATLALFDKPDPLEGPTFAETLYITPSRAPEDTQRELRATAQNACRALGLRTGPVHIELRYNDRGPWIVEAAARPIGGRCGEVLSFGPSGTVSLETVLLAHTLGQLDVVPPREAQAAGVMMIPVPRPGTFQAMNGLDRARAVPGVVDIAVTIHPGAPVRPLPDEARYLGFLFARGATPSTVEHCLREAWAEVEVVIE